MTYYGSSGKTRSKIPKSQRLQMINGKEKEHAKANYPH